MVTSTAETQIHFGHGRDGVHPPGSIYYQQNKSKKQNLKIKSK